MQTVSIYICTLATEYPGWHQTSETKFSLTGQSAARRPQIQSVQSYVFSFQIFTMYIFYGYFMYFPSFKINHRTINIYGIISIWLILCSWLEISRRETYEFIYCLFLLRLCGNRKERKDSNKHEAMEWGLPTRVACILRQLHGQFRILPSSFCLPSRTSTLNLSCRPPTANWIICDGKVVRPRCWLCEFRFTATPTELPLLLPGRKASGKCFLPLSIPGPPLYIFFFPSFYRAEQRNYTVLYSWHDMTYTLFIRAIWFIIRIIYFMMKLLL